MAATEAPGLTPVQRVIYETDLLGLNLRESSRIATQRAGFFVGQAKYLEERKRIAQYIAQYGPLTPAEHDTDQSSNVATHQIGSP